MATSLNDAKRQDFLAILQNAARRKLHGTQSRDDDAILFMANTLFSLKAQVGHLKGGDYEKNEKEEAYFQSIGEISK